MAFLFREIRRRTKISEKNIAHKNQIAPICGIITPLGITASCPKPYREAIVQYFNSVTTLLPAITASGMEKIQIIRQVKQ